jgi:hypothetical protein
VLSALSRFLEYLKSAPRSVQIVAVLSAALVTGVFFVYKEKMAQGNSPIGPVPLKTSTTPIASGSAPVGTYDPANGHADPAQPSRSSSSIKDANDQMVAGSWHNQHSGFDDPKWQYIDRGDQTYTFVKYRYFNHSDRCLDIVRSEHGKTNEKWVFDPSPEQILHPIDTTTESSSGSIRTKQSHEPATNSMAELTDLLGSIFINDAKALGLPASTNSSAATLSRISGQLSGPQFCVNPHPGRFTWYWGPVSGCLQPMFRVFDDKCTHYQMFNHCTNTWDQQVYWTYCTAPHSQ